MSYPSVDNGYDVRVEIAPQSPKPSRRHHTVHIPLLLISLAAIALLTLGINLVLRYQVQRTADSLMLRVDELEKSGQYAEATICLQRYLTLKPDDEAAYTRLATAYDRGLVDARDSRKLERAVRHYLRAIGVAALGDRVRLRKRLCELLFEQERYSLAESHAAELVHSRPKDPTCWRLLALSIYGNLSQRSFALKDTDTEDKIGLGHALERSLELNPVDVKMASLLAEVYRHHPDLLSPEQKQRVQRAAEARLGPEASRLAKLFPNIAKLNVKQAEKVRHAVVALEQTKQSQHVRMVEQIFASMIEGAPENALVWAARFAYRDKYNMSGSAEDLQKALELAPHDSRLLLVAGQKARQQATTVRDAARTTSLSAANQYFQRILELSDSSETGGKADRQQREEQMAILRQAYLGLGQVALTRGDPQEAIQWFQDGAEGIGKEDVRFRLHLADALLMAGQQVEAAAEIERVTSQLIEKSPSLRPSAQFALRRSLAMVHGKLYLHQGSPIDAIREFKRVVLDDEPNKSARELTYHAYHLMGTAYARMEQWDLAGAAYEHALEIRPNYVDALHSAVFAWKKVNRLQKAVDLYTEYLPEQIDIQTRLDLADILLQVQQELAPSERDWAPLENTRAKILENQSKLNASQECRVLLLDVSHVLARQTELLTLEPSGRVLFTLRAERDKSGQDKTEQEEAEPDAAEPAEPQRNEPQLDETEQVEASWEFQESHLSFLQRLLPELDVEPACQAILSRSPDPSVRDDKGKSIQQLLRALCLLQLREATERAPALDPLRWRISRLFETLDKPQEANEALGRLKKSQPVSVDMLISQVLWYIQHQNLDAARKLFQTPWVMSASAEDQLILEDARIDLELRDGSAQSLQQSRKLLEARCHDHPQDTHAVWQLALLSLQQNDLQETQKWTLTLRQLEEDGGVLSKHIEMLRLLAQLEDDSNMDRSIPGRAHALVNQIVKHRPHWPEGWILSARLASHESHWKKAAADYKKAVQFGAVEPSVYQELVSLLFRLGDYHDANRYLERIRPDIGTSSSLSALAVNVSARLGENKNALELAWERVNESPDDPVAWLWLSRMQWVNGLQTVAERSILKARELAPRDVRIAYTQFAYRVENGQIDKARDLLLEIGENATFVTPIERCLVKARGYESLGNVLKAGEQYQRSAKLAPKDVAIQLQVASFFLERDANLAEKYLRTALVLRPDSPLTRRNLGSLLLAKDTREAREEARDLLDPLDHSEHGQRLRAMLLLQQRPASLEPARRILERLVESKARDTDRFQLANVYLIDSPLQAKKEKRLQRLEQARKGYHFLATKQKAKPEHVMRYIDFLLRYHSRDEATKWLPPLREATLRANDGVNDSNLERLLGYLEFLLTAEFVEQAGKEIDSGLTGTEIPVVGLLERTIDLLLQTGKYEKATDLLQVLRETRPKSFSTMARQARWLCGLGRDAEVPALIDPYANRWVAQQGNRAEHAKLALYVARLYAELELDEASEHWYRKLMQYDPLKFEPLARHLARQQDWPALIALVEEGNTEESSVHSTIVLARCLTLVKPPDSLCELAEQRCTKALDLQSDNFSLLVAIAGFHQHQGHHADAAKLYQHALQLQPDHVEVLSHLAQCLSHDAPLRSQAFDRINQALKIVGPRADLLATKGMIYFYADNSKEGIDLLQTAASTIHSSPKHQFYYALMLTRIDALDQARQVWRSLSLDELAPSLDVDERNRLTELQQILSVP